MTDGCTVDEKNPIWEGIMSMESLPKQLTKTKNKNSIAIKKKVLCMRVIKNTQISQLKMNFKIHEVYRVKDNRKLWDKIITWWTNNQTKNIEVSQKDY